MGITSLTPHIGLPDTTTAMVAVSGVVDGRCSTFQLRTTNSRHWL